MLVVLVPSLLFGVAIGFVTTGAMRDHGASASTPGAPTSTSQASGLLTGDLSPSSSVVAQPRMDASGEPTNAEPTNAEPTNAEPTGDDAISTARSGDCFNDKVVGGQSNLTPTSCGPNTYQVLQRLDNTTDSKLCDNIDGADFSVSYPDRDVVLCLSYQYSDGAAHAAVGSCIGQSVYTQGWYPYACQPGTFKILARYRNTLDASKCGTWPRSDWSINYNVPRNSTLDLVLCLSYQYTSGGDSGYAQVNDCMNKVGGGAELAFHFPDGSTCDGTNVVITGRDNLYNDRNLCGNDGWQSEEVPRYPQFTYTVCWRPR